MRLRAAVPDRVEIPRETSQQSWGPDSHSAISAVIIFGVVLAVVIVVPVEALTIGLSNQRKSELGTKKTDRAFDEGISEPRENSSIY